MQFHKGNKRKLEDLSISDDEDEPANKYKGRFDTVVCIMLTTNIYTTGQMVKKAHFKLYCSH